MEDSIGNFTETLLKVDANFVETFRQQSELHFIKDGVRIIYKIDEDCCYVSKDFAGHIVTLKSRKFGLDEIDIALKEHKKFVNGEITF